MTLSQPLPPSTSTRWNRAWGVAAVTLGALVAAAAFRSSTGVLLEPIEGEFGWSRTMTSGAVSLNLVLYGLTAPFAAALMEKWGVRRTVALALVAVGSASGLTTMMSSPWQLWVLWGLVIGVGTGAMALSSAPSWPTAGSTPTAAWSPASSPQPTRPASSSSSRSSRAWPPDPGSGGLRAWSPSSLG